MLAVACVAGTARAEVVGVTATADLGPSPKAGPGTAGKVDARLTLTELYSLDNQTRQNLSYGEGRAVLDTEELFFVPKLELHADGRFRHGWTDITGERRDIDRLFVKYGDRASWSVAFGRQPIVPLLGAQIDGVTAGLGIAEGLGVLVFGGLRPHPLTGNLDSRFRTLGVGYDAHDKATNHAGGLGVDWFGDNLDRLYLSERGYLRLAEAWTLYGQAVVDLMSPQGILDETRLTQATKDSATDGLDLTNGMLRLRYQARGIADVSLSTLYLHAIVPTKWWWDWIAAERAKRGFSADELDNVGTRRGSVTSDVNLRFSQTVVPHLSLRADRRFADQENGWEGRPGVKVMLSAWGYADVSYSYRRYYDEAINNQLSATFGADFTRDLGVEVSTSAMHTRKRGGLQTEMLYDVGGFVRTGLGLIHDSLADLDFMAQYQGFIDPEMVFHLFFARVSYRFKG
jgi:hypothetical protein